MRRDVVTSLQTIFVLSSICCSVKSSSIEHGASIVPAPVVTAASSQYFERTFNRLVAVPQAVQPIVPVLPQQPVFVEPVTKTVLTAPAVQNVPVEPNIAIAIATAHAAAPVATFLLPPYPFVPSHASGLVPSVQPTVLPSESPKREPTTPQPTTQVDVQTTLTESEPTTPLPSNSDNSFVQALPSNQNVNFENYYPPLYPPPLPTPPPIPQQGNSHNFKPTYQNNNLNKPFNQYYAPNFPQAQQPRKKPQKLKTTVEIIPVPLQYIAPPPLKNEQIILKHVHAYIPRSAKIVIRPMAASLKIRKVRVPAKILVYKMPLIFQNSGPRYPQNALRKSLVFRDIEPTTFRPFLRPNSKPPKV